MIQVSNHALLRYFERIVGIDIEEAGRAMIEEVRRTIAVELGAPLANRLVEFGGGARCRIKLGDTIYCMRGETVTTCFARRSH